MCDRDGGATFADKEPMGECSGKEKLAGKDICLQFAALVCAVILDALQPYGC